MYEKRVLLLLKKLEQNAPFKNAISTDPMKKNNGNIKIDIYKV